jgi:DUF1680 family protein
VAGTIATLGGYWYAVSRDSIYVNQYHGSVARVRPGGTPITLTQKTDYPWGGTATLLVQPDGECWEGTIRLRVPDWCRDLESMGGLYRPRRAGSAQPPAVRINGQRVKSTVRPDGYIAIHRHWRRGDCVTLDMPMPVMRIASHARVAANRGRVAIQRGPLVYAIEAVDHDGSVRDIHLPPDAPLRTESRPDLLGGIRVIVGQARRRTGPGKSAVPVTLTAIPYAFWANRRVGEMDVWLAETIVTPDR